MLNTVTLQKVYFLILIPVYKLLKNTLILDILELHDSLTTSEIICCWLPGHVGIKGNTLADAAAKAAHTALISPMSIPYSDTKHAVSTYIKSLRQEKWK